MGSQWAEKQTETRLKEVISISDNVSPWIYFLLPRDDKRTVECGKCSTQLKQINVAQNWMRTGFLRRAPLWSGNSCFYLFTFFAARYHSRCLALGISGSTWDGVVWVSRNMKKVSSVNSDGVLLVFLVFLDKTWSAVSQIKPSGRYKKHTKMKRKQTKRQQKGQTHV